MKQLLARILVMAFSLNLFCMFMSDIPHTHAAETKTSHEHDSSDHHDSKKTFCAGCEEAILGIGFNTTEKRDVLLVLALPTPWFDSNIHSDILQAGEVPFIPHAPPWSSQLEKILESTRLLL